MNVLKGQSKMLDKIVSLILLQVLYDFMNLLYNLSMFLSLYTNTINKILVSFPFNFFVNVY